MNVDGLTFNNASEVYQGYSVTAAMLWLTFDAFLYIFLGLYMDQVIPSTYGVAKPWYFLCQCKKNKGRLNDDQQSLLGQDKNEESNHNSRNFEQVSEALKRQEQTGECIKVRGLVKTFGPKKAVKGVDLEMYKGQIFALLGHNGAGKTTTLSMLTGLLEPSAGVAEVFGTNMFHNMDDIRRILGVCPQHDVLFKNLTPEEHLKIYATFKRSKPEEIQ